MIVQEEFWRHLERHIPPEKQLRCSKCPFVTDLKHHFEYHQHRHSGVKPFRCSRCGYACVNRSMLNSHSKSHSNVFPFRCATCSFAAKYSHALKVHLFKYRHSAGPTINKDGSLRFPSEEIRSTGKASPGRNQRRALDDIRRFAGFCENYYIRTTSTINEAARSTRNDAIAHEAKGFLGQMELGTRDGEIIREDWIMERECEPSRDFSIADGFRLNCHLPSPGIMPHSASQTKLRKSLPSSYPCSDYYSCVSGILGRDAASRPEFPAAYRSSDCSSELRNANIASSEKDFELRQEGIRLKTPSTSLADIGSRVHCYGDREIDCEMFEFDRNKTLTEPLDLTKRKKKPIDSALNTMERRTGENIKFEKSNLIAALSPQIISRLNLDRKTNPETKSFNSRETLNSVSPTMADMNNRGEFGFVKSSNHHHHNQFVSALPPEQIPIGREQPCPVVERGHRASPPRCSESKDNNCNASRREESFGRGSSDDSNELVLDRRREFECLHCRMVFQDPIIYLIHASYHGDVDPLQCRLCGERCSDRSEFMVHLFQAAHDSDNDKMAIV